MKTNFLVLISCSLISIQCAFADITQQSFASPTEAMEALVNAANNQDMAALTKIFGADFISEIKTGDPTADKFNLQQLSDRLNEKHGLAPGKNGMQIIEVSNSQTPFPAPLIEKDGKWIFDSDVGTDEVINRRIGLNELGAINATRFYVDAQNLYHSKDRTGTGQSYARKILSSPGKKDGLYWPYTGDQISPINGLVERARNEGYRVLTSQSDVLYQGYHFKVLTKQGKSAPGGEKNYVSRNGKMTEGFGLIAYPARWGVSGINSFIVGPDGKVYEKDFGTKTAQVAPLISKFDPDQSWSELNS